MKKICSIFLLLLFLFPLYPKDIVTLNNVSFEETKDNFPLYWEPWFYEIGDDSAEIQVVTTNPYDGKNCVLIHNKKETDTRLIQTITLPAHKTFAFSCRIRTENIKKEGVGAVISVMDYISTSEFVFGTNEKWRKKTLYIQTGDQGKDVTLCLCLGGYSAGSSGKAYFDGVNLVEVDSIPSGAPVVKVAHIPTYEQQIMEEAKKQKEERALQKQKEQRKKVIFFYIILSVVLLSGAAFIALDIFLIRKNITVIKQRLDKVTTGIKTVIKKITGKLHETGKFHVIAKLLVTAKTHITTIKKFILTHKYFYNRHDTPQSFE